MKSPSGILNFIGMDEKDEDSFGSDFLVDNCIISDLISRLDEETSTSIDSLEEIKLKAKSENLSTTKISELKCEINKTDNNNLDEFVKRFKTENQPTTVTYRTKPRKNNGFELQCKSKTVATKEILLEKKLLDTKSPEKQSLVQISDATESKYELFQSFSLDDQESLEKLSGNIKIKVQDFKPFIGNKNFYEGIFIKSLKKRMENHDKESQSPELAKKPKKSKHEEIPAQIEDVKVREIINCDLISPPSSDIVATPKNNLSLKSILTNSPSATPNSTSSSMKTPKKVTFCNLIFVKNIEIDYEAERGISSEEDSDSYDDDDSDDEDFTI